MARPYNRRAPEGANLTGAKESVRLTLIKIALLGALLCPSLLRAQVRFDVAGREVQVHGFMSEGFALTDQNNYLRMKTSEGSMAHFCCSKPT